MFQTTDTKLNQNRVSTGIPGMDALLEGGYPKGHVILLSGTPGTGKTIACLQFLREGLKKNESILYVSTDQPLQQLKKESTAMGFDLSEYLESKQVQLLYLSSETVDMYKTLKKTLSDYEFQRVIIDSLTPFSEQPVWMVHEGHEQLPSPGLAATKVPLNSQQAQRAHIRYLITLLKEKNCTTLLTSEIPEGSRSLSRDSISEFLSDGIILLSLDSTMDRRMLTIRKMRETKHTLKTQPVEITNQGILLKQ